MCHFNFSCHHFPQFFKGLAYPVSRIIIGSLGVFSMLTEQADNLVCVAAMICMDSTSQGVIDRVLWAPGSLSGNSKLDGDSTR
jgi:hypothetical protein